MHSLRIRYCTLLCIALIGVTILPLFSSAGSVQSGKRGIEGQFEYNIHTLQETSAKPSYPGPSKRDEPMAIERVVMDVIMRAPAKQANQWVMKHFNCDEKTARSMIKSSVSYYQDQASFWEANAATARFAEQATPVVVFACDVLLTGGGGYQAAVEVAKTMGKKEMALFATQGANAICKTFYYFAKYGAHKHGNPKMGTSADMFKYISDALSTFNLIFGTSVAATQDKVNTVIGYATDANITAARNMIAKGVADVLPTGTHRAARPSFSDMPTPYDVSPLGTSGTLRVMDSTERSIPRAVTNRRISYRVYAGSKKKQRPQGQVTLKNGAKFTALNIPGGCGANDFAQCVLDAEGRLHAYYKDSCEQRGVKGPTVSSGSSKAVFKKYSCECWFSDSK